MKYKASFLGCLALVLAFIGAGFEILGVWEYVSELHAGRYVYVYCFLAGICPALPALATFWKRDGKRGWKWATWGGFAICLVIVFVAAVQRTGSAADLAQEQRERATRSTKLAERAESDARVAYDVAQSAAVRECSDKRGPKCMDAEAKAGELRTALAIAVAKLQAAPGTQHNSLAMRVPYLTEEQVEALWPMLPPIGVSVLSAIFFAYWQRLDIKDIDAPAPAAEPEMMQPEPRMRVVPFVRREVRPALPRPTPIEAPPQRPAIPIPQVFGSLRKFSEACLTVSKGERLEARAAIVRYRNWCKENRLTTADARKCLDELERLYEIEMEGETPYFKDVRLIA